MTALLQSQPLFWPMLLIAAGLSLTMFVAWAVQRLTSHSGWIDVIWSFGVGAGGLAAALLPGLGAAPRHYMVALLILLWSLRLGLHILNRTLKGGDDPRYAALIAQWGKSAGWQLFLFLQIQALAALVLVLAVRLAATSPAPFPSIGDAAGLALLIVAVAGEAVADAQIERFRHAHKGEHLVCDTGLWSWSRHPNYFFEWLGWCAWAVIAIVPAFTGFGWLALAAPAMMYGLLVHVSGVPPLEAHMLKSRGDAFRAYQARVSPFFPLPPHSAPKGVTR
ncbi:DUF1295 domain-containing protein [Asticcacaulis sp. EMRT-3]|uniref:DUF1295 domain-containing protein n=1 Tax=Asticcacaulis sp. EMRT-3 TaxID=3040349 RepID=UPI0024AF8ED6|nr:DUF1295 domain-containing protein [Asticcacaulis sp. EMRT-3]MDI7776108.1 DUF1295 domain-containing protein [Asticcacaulis sp. EMRT-3]